MSKNLRIKKPRRLITRKKQKRSQSKNNRSKIGLVVAGRQTFHQRRSRGTATFTKSSSQGALPSRGPPISTMTDQMIPVLLADRQVVLFRLFPRHHNPLTLKTNPHPQNRLHHELRARRPNSLRYGLPWQSALPHHQNGMQTQAA